MSDAPVPFVPSPEPLRAPSLSAQLMRASDQDRDEVAHALAIAFAEGRLSADEHGDRLSRAMNAKTLGELAPLTHDLAASLAPQSASRAVDASGSSTGQAFVLAVFGGSRREGNWRVPAKLINLTLFGGTRVDMSSAVLESHTTDINVVCIYGGTTIVVPHGVRVVNNVVALFGGAKVADSGVVDPDAPIIRVSGLCLFGGVKVTVAPSSWDAPAARELR